MSHCGYLFDHKCNSKNILILSNCIFNLKEEKKRSPSYGHFEFLWTVLHLTFPNQIYQIEQLFFINFIGPEQFVQSGSEINNLLFLSLKYRKRCSLLVLLLINIRDGGQIFKRSVDVFVSWGKKLPWGDNSLKFYHPIPVRITSLVLKSLSILKA